MRYLIIISLCLLGIASAQTPRTEGLVLRPSPPEILSLSASDFMTLFNTSGKQIVTINLNTGHVTLYGNPNEAAKIFWKAVGKETQKGCVDPSRPSKKLKPSPPPVTPLTGSQREMEVF